MTKEPDDVPITSTRQRPFTPAESRTAQSPLRVATLTRISTDEVDQPYSLDSQAASLDAFVTSQPTMTITHRVVDQASGATLD